MTNNAKEFFIRAVGVPVGFLLSLIGVILPWRARNAYLNLVGLVFDIILRSNAILGYFMKVGFSTGRISSVMVNTQGVKKEEDLQYEKK